MYGLVPPVTDAVRDSYWFASAVELDAVQPVDARGPFTITSVVVE